MPGLNGGILVSAYDINNNNTNTVLFSPDFLSTIVVVQTGLLSDGSIRFSDTHSGWLSGAGQKNNDIYRFRGNLISYTGSDENMTGNLNLQVHPNPSSAEAILKLPLSWSGKTVHLRISNISGQVVDNRIITTASSFIQLDATRFRNGIYFITLTADGGASAVCRWMVYH